MADRNGVNLYLFLVYCSFVSFVLPYSVQNENQLQTDLLTGYNANVRPTEQVLIKCSLNIRNILYLDMVEQTLAVSGSLVVIWSDNRLLWRSSDYGNVTDIYLRTDQIWKPTLLLQNSVKNIEVIGDNGNQKSIPVVVGFYGGLFWLAPAYFISYCSVDVSKFPFDTQSCELKISGWLYTMDVLQLEHLEDKVLFEYFEENGEYDVVRTRTRVDRYPMQSTYVETLVFVIELKRKYSYYLINIVLPVLLMQLLGLVVFTVPTESGEKLTFSLTLLLSLTVMMTMVAERIPTTSLQIPTLSVYMFGGAVISSLEVLMTVVILHFKHCHVEDGCVVKGVLSLMYVTSMLKCKKRNKVKTGKDEIFCQAEKANDNTTVEDLTSDRNCDQDKVKVPVLAFDRTNENESKHPNRNTTEEIAGILETFSLVFFTVITLVFTFVMLAMAV